MFESWQKVGQTIPIPRPYYDYTNHMGKWTFQFVLNSFCDDGNAGLLSISSTRTVGR